MRLDGRGHLRPEAGLAECGKAEQLGGRTLEQGLLHVSEQCALQARESLWKVPRPKSLARGTGQPRTRD